MKVEILKKRKMELKAARLAKRSKTSEGSVKKPKKTEEESPSDDEDDEDDEDDDGEVPRWMIDIFLLIETRKRMIRYWWNIF